MRKVTSTLALVVALSIGGASFAIAQSQQPGASGSTGLSPKGDMQAADKQKGGSMKQGRASSGSSGGMKGGDMSSGTSNGSPASGGMTK